VDMIATGTDVKPLECLVFMRDVKSRNYFEQMKGRGTRTLGYDDLKKVNPSAVSEKTHFVIVDAIGVTKSLKTDSRPLERKPTISLKDLLGGVLMGCADEDTVSSLASRLSRLNKKLTEPEQEKIREASGGRSLPQIVRSLLVSIDPDEVEEHAREKFSLTTEQEPSDEQYIQAKEDLISEVSKEFSGELNTAIETIRREHEQTIDNYNIDEVTKAEWDKESAGGAEDIVREFSDYISHHKDEIIALSIFYDQPKRRRELAYGMIKDLLAKLKSDKPKLAPVRVWQAYSYLDNYHGSAPNTELTALVSLIRRATGVDESLTPYDQTVRRNFQNWIMKKHQGAGEKFNEEQMDWLRMIRNHVASSFHVEKDDLDYAPFDSKGGLGKMWKLFGEGMDELIDELNEALAA